MHFKRIAAGLFLLTACLFTGVQVHAQPANISQKVAVCDPQFPTHCIKPASDGSVPTTGSGGGGAGAVYGPTADGSPSANPPVQVGGTIDGTSTGAVAAWKVDSSGNGSVTATNAFNLEATQLLAKADLDAIAAGVGSAIPAGTAIIGKVGIDQTTDGTTNGVHLVAGTAIAGKVGIDQTTPGTTNAVQPIAGTTGGATPYGLQTAATTNSTNVKNAAGVLYGMNLLNTTTTIYYLRMYDAAAAPTCSSATNFVRTWPIPPTTAAGGSGGIAVALPITGTQFSTGISFCVTGGPSSTDNTSAATGVFINLDYK